METKDIVKRGKDDLMSIFPNFGRFRNLFDEMSCLFNDATCNYDMAAFFNDIQPKGSFPRMNVSETDDAYSVELAIAGYSKEDINLEIKDNVLFVSGNNNSEEETEDKKFLRREISRRSFKRAIKFPMQVNVDDISCTYSDGIITCTLNKMLDDSDDSKKININ